MKKIAVTFLSILFVAGILVMTGCDCEDSTKNNEAGKKLLEQGIKYNLTTEEGYEEALQDDEFMSNTVDALITEEQENAAPVSTGILGDVNSDGAVKITDSLLVAKYYIGADLEYFDETVADVNGDLKIDITDSLLIAQFYVGQITEFPVENGLETTLKQENDELYKSAGSKLLIDNGDSFVMGGDMLLDKNDPVSQALVNDLLRNEAGLEEREYPEINISDNPSETEGSKGHVNTEKTVFWRYMKIRYFLDSSFSQSEKNNILNSMKLLESVCDIEFVDVNTLDKDPFFYTLRIRLLPDYSESSQATLGRQKYSYLHLTKSGAKTPGTIVHELCHVLGMSHEHQRYDRDKYVTFHPENTYSDWPGVMSNFETVPRTKMVEKTFLWFHYTTEDIISETYGDYDYDSIMHYDPYAFSNNGEMTLDAHGLRIGQSNHLSEGDRYTLRKIYGPSKKTEQYSYYNEWLRNSDPWIYQYSEEKDGMVITGYAGVPITSSRSNFVYVPSIINNVKVVAIGDFAFRESCEIPRLIIPSTVTYISPTAFVGGHVYDVMVNSTKYTTDNCVNGSLFDNENRLVAYTRFWDRAEYIIPDTTKIIGTKSFAHSTDLVSVTIPDSVTSIEDEAFFYCPNLTSINLPDSITSLGEGVFSGCSNLKEVILPANMSSMTSDLFKGCTSLTSVTIPGSVTVIGRYSLSGWHNLTSINIPESVTKIEEYAFFDNWNLESIDIPDSVTSIGASAFSQCYKINSIFIPDSVAEISPNTFYYCDNLKSIVIPESVTSIGNEAFLCCTSLNAVTVNSVSPPSLGRNVFANTASDLVIYVPAVSLNAYKNAEGWSHYKDIIQANPEQ
ncbi:MAG: leucine-rich repeat protein [Spirochaetes bacterium]|nr:leucine-rich repeat protein [Spirochaetota bacterium]